MDQSPSNRIKLAASNQDGRLLPLASSDNAQSMDSMTKSKIRATVDKLDLKGQGAIERLKKMFKRPVAASLVSTEIVEGRTFNSDGRVRPIKDTIGPIKYDSGAAGAFGTSPSKELRDTSMGRQIIANQLSAAEIAARNTPRGTMVLKTALKAAGIAAEALGAVGDLMDVLQIVQVFGNAMYYDPGCTANPANPALCKFPTDFLKASQTISITRLVLKKQIELLAGYTPKSLAFKPVFPLIRGPLDVLSVDPYINQTLIQLELDAVQNRILNQEPWRSKFVTYFGSQVVNEIINDQADGLSYYTASVGMTDAEIDTVYEEAFRTVCSQNRGKVWKDTYTSGRPRYQCGFTIADCETARTDYFTSRSKGNYVEWYTYADIETVLADTPRLAATLNFTSKPGDETGFCMVSSPGVAGLCNYYRGIYNVSTHQCEFTKEYCQSIGTCFNKPDKTCYLPSKEMEALNFFFAGGGVREWIKVNGCSFIGNDADKAKYTVASVVYTFAPFTMLFTANGRKMFQDAIANSKNWGPGIKAQLNDPNVGVGFASAIVGLGTMAATIAGVASTGVGMGVAALMMIAMGITLGLTIASGEIEESQTAKVDKEDMAFHGLQKLVVTTSTTDLPAGTYYIPTSRGYTEGWVTRKLPVTKRADNTLCTAVENFNNPTTCSEVAWTAENPQVFETRFARTTNQLKSGGVGTTEREEVHDYNNKVQCWKHDWDYEEKYSTLSNKTTSPGFKKIYTPADVGKPYGAVNTAMNNKIFDGYIRAGTLGSKNQTWCIDRRPATTFFDSTIGTPAVESEYKMNRSWTSKYGDTGLYYPEYPTEASKLSAKTHNHFRYQLVYAKGSIPVQTMWNDLLMEAIFTETTISEIRRHYCEQELIRVSSDTSQINKKCFGYLKLNISGYTWLAMSIPGRTMSNFNSITGTVTMGIPTNENVSGACAEEYGVNFEEGSKGLCYLNCNYGTGATSDGYAYVSREWESDSSMICYKQYEKWEDNNRGHGEQTITKNIFVAEYVGTPSSCSSNKEQGGGFCYPLCSSLSSYDPTKYEYLNDGSTQCYKHDLIWETEASRKGRPAGTGPRTYSTMNKPLAFSATRRGLKANGVCPTGYDRTGLDGSHLCMPQCGSGQRGIEFVCYDINCHDDETEHVEGMCTRNCDDGYFYSGGTCYKNCSNYGKGQAFPSALGMCRQTCQSRTFWGSVSTSTYDYGGTGTCAATNSFSCPSSYDRTGVGTVAPTCHRPFASRPRSETCPSGYSKVGSLCEKQTYFIGYGTPKQCDITSAGVCHMTNPWRCTGGVREEVEGSCYNPCQPGFNSGIICPSGANNINGYCMRPGGTTTTTTTYNWVSGNVVLYEGCDFARTASRGRFLLPISPDISSAPWYQGIDGGYVWDKVRKNNLSSLSIPLGVTVELRHTINYNGSSLRIDGAGPDNVVQFAYGMVSGNRVAGCTSSKSNQEHVWDNKAVEWRAYWNTMGVAGRIQKLEWGVPV